MSNILLYFRVKLSTKIVEIYWVIILRNKEILKEGIKQLYKEGNMHTFFSKTPIRIYYKKKSSNSE